MARQQAEAPRFHRYLSIASVAALASASALAFSRVFASNVVALELVLVALASVALAGLMERRNLLLATLVSAVGLLFALGIVVFPETTFFGIPTPHTIEAIWDATKIVGHQARVEIAPTIPLQPLMMGAVTAVWTAAFSAHALAVRSGSPFLAALPPAALLAFASMVLEEGPRPAYAFLFLLAVLFVLFADGLQRVRQWGPLRPWTSGGRSRFTSPTMTRGARRVALGAIVVALFLPGVLPGYGSPAIVDLDANNSGLVAVNPLVSVASALRRKQDVEVFSVDVSPAGQGSYWRTMALDRFDGDTWDTPDMTLEGGTPLSGQTDLEPLATQALAEGTATEITQTVHITGLEASPWLPMASEPFSLTMPTGTVRYDADLGAMVAPDGLGAGASYTVQSLLVAPDPKDLDRDYEWGPEYDRYLQLPDLPDRIAQITEQVTEDQPNDFRKIIAIQTFLKSFDYDTQVDLGGDSDAIVRFLDEVKAGFCQQFAGTMAVMLRQLGIPSRVAVGFTPGKLGDDGLYHVRSTNYHAWVEVPFPGYGWLAFEPTPTRSNPVAAEYQVIPPEEDPGDPSCVVGGCENAQAGTSGGSVRRDSQDPDTVRGEGAGGPVGGIPVGPIPAVTPPVEEQRGFPLWEWIVGALLLLVLLAVAVPVTKKVSRRIGVARAKAPREVVLAAYRLFSGEAADAGLGRRRGETLWEHRARLRRRVHFSDGHLDRLTGITGRAVYSTRTVDDELAREAVDAAKVAARDVRKAQPLGARMAGLYRLKR
jgi:hypothetical protein